MNELTGETGFTRSRLAGWLPHVLALGGLVLAYFDSRFLIVAAAGFFGPGILAELGLVRVEEFRQETNRRAAHQAFLVTGVLLVLVSGFEGCGQRYNAEMHKIDDAIPASFAATVLLAVYYLSSLVRYWGARVAAFRILVFYGAVFAVLHAGGLFLARSLLNPFPWGDVLQFSGMAVLIFGAAFLGRSRPKAGSALVAVAMVWLMIQSGVWRMVSTGNGWPWEISFEVVIYFLLLPVTAIVALLFGGPDPE